MSLFRVSPEGLTPFAEVEIRALGGATDPLATAIWRDLNAVTGERLFPVTPSLRPDRFRDTAAIPAMVAVDGPGNVALTYVKPAFDHQSLAECMLAVGWARGASITELASMYSGGSEAFWRDWQRFAGSAAPPVLTRTPRVTIVASEITGTTRSALDFLMEHATPVTVLVAKLYRGGGGDEILQVQAANRAERRQERPTRLNGHKADHSHKLEQSTKTEPRPKTDKVPTTEHGVGEALPPQRTMFPTPGSETPAAQRWRDPEPGAESPHETPPGDKEPVRLSPRPTKPPGPRRIPPAHDVDVDGPPTNGAGEGRPNHIRALPSPAIDAIAERFAGGTNGSQPRSEPPRVEPEPAQPANPARSINPLVDTLAGVSPANGGTRLTGIPVSATPNTHPAESQHLGDSEIDTTERRPVTAIDDPRTARNLVAYPGGRDNDSDRRPARHSAAAEEISDGEPTEHPRLARNNAGRGIDAAWHNDNEPW